VAARAAAAIVTAIVTPVVTAIVAAVAVPLVPLVSLPRLPLLFAFLLPTFVGFPVLLFPPGVLFLPMAVRDVAFMTIPCPVIPGHVHHGPGDRSEERRVGKECRSRWSPYH